MRLLRAAYTLGWLFLIGLAPVGALLSDKFRRWWRARKSRPPEPPVNKPLIWMHCASVGEFEQGRPIIEHIVRQMRPRPYVVVTFFSPSGWERYRQSYPVADWIGPLPFDIPWVMRKWIAKLNPIAVFFVRYDLWPNLLHLLRERSIPTYLLASHVHSYRGLRWVWQKYLFRHMTHIFVQTAQDQAFLLKEGFSEVTLAGNSRSLRVKQIREHWIPISGIQEWIGNRFCIVAGSVWAEDVRFLARAYTQLRGLDIRWILVPHEVRSKTIDQIRQLWPTPFILYSQSEWPERYHTLVIDTMGLLAYLYAYAHLVWVGGGFGAGIHNILEPAVYGKAVFFGPRYERFPEAHELIQLGIAESCKYPSAFSNAVRALTKDRRRLSIIEGKAEQYFASLPDTREIVWQVVSQSLDLSKGKQSDTKTAN